MRRTRFCRAKHRPSFSKFGGRGVQALSGKIDIVCRIPWVSPPCCRFQTIQDESCILRPIFETTAEYIHLVARSRRNWGPVWKISWLGSGSIDEQTNNKRRHTKTIVYIHSATLQLYVVIMFLLMGGQHEMNGPLGQSTYILQADNALDTISIRAWNKVRF